jgi:cytochrome P450
MVKGAPADLVSSLTDPMPAIVVCELLGIDDRDLLYAWLRASADELDRATEDVSAYLLDLIERKRAWPVDDLLSALVQVRDGQDRLTEAELLMTMLSLFGAGQETTSSQLAMSMLVLGHHPDQWDRLVADPDLVSQAIEELLRYVGLGPAFPRVASTELELSGVAVHAGEAIFPVLDVANRDPLVFPDPDRFDVTRADAGLHLSFGRGIHFCLGAPLARLELRTALKALVTTLPTLRLAEPDDEPDWNDTVGLKSLLVTW